MDDVARAINELLDVDRSLDDLLNVLRLFLDLLDLSVDHILNGNLHNVLNEVLVNNGLLNHALNLTLDDILDWLLNLDLSDDLDGLLNVVLDGFLCLFDHLLFVDSHIGRHDSVVLVVVDFVLGHLDEFLIVYRVLNNGLDLALNDALSGNFLDDVDVDRSLDRLFDGHFNDPLNGHVHNLFIGLLNVDLSDDVFFNDDLSGTLNDNVVGHIDIDILGHRPLNNDVDHLLDDDLVDDRALGVDVDGSGLLHSSNRRGLLLNGQAVLSDLIANVHLAINFVRRQLSHVDDLGLHLYALHVSVGQALLAHHAVLSRPDV